jgi:hypothetical protein
MSISTSIMVGGCKVPVGSLGYAFILQSRNCDSSTDAKYLYQSYGRQDKKTLLFNYEEYGVQIALRMNVAVDGLTNYGHLR